MAKPTRPREQHKNMDKKQFLIITLQERKVAHYIMHLLGTLHYAMASTPRNRSLENDESVKPRQGCYQQNCNYCIISNWILCSCGANVIEIKKSCNFVQDFI